MGKADQYNELIFKLGDLARERLVSREKPPRTMSRVLKAEEAVIARQEELADLEQQMNDADAEFQDAEAAYREEFAELQAVVKQFKRAVDGVEGRVRDLRKRLAARRLDHRHAQTAIKKAELRHRDLEMGGNPTRIEESRQVLRKMRLMALRMGNEVKDMEQQMDEALTPLPGQPGGEGIVARRRQLELEDQAEQRRADHEEQLAELDAALAVKEEEVQAAEDYLDQALFLLGEECYTQRLEDPSLSALYPRLDRVA
jgi:hypothetical protein